MKDKLAGQINILRVIEMIRPALRRSDFSEVISLFSENGPNIFKGVKKLFFFSLGLLISDDIL